MARKIRYSTFVANVSKKLTVENGWLCEALRQVMQESIPNHSQYELRFKRYIKSLLRIEASIRGKGYESTTLAHILYARGYITELYPENWENVRHIAKQKLLADYITYLKARKQ